MLVTNVSIGTELDITILWDCCMEPQQSELVVACKSARLNLCLWYYYLLFVRYHMHELRKWVMICSVILRVG